MAADSSSPPSLRHQKKSLPAMRGINGSKCVNHAFSACCVPLCYCCIAGVPRLVQPLFKGGGRLEAFCIAGCRDVMLQLQIKIFSLCCRQKDFQQEHVACRPTGYLPTLLAVDKSTELVVTFYPSHPRKGILLLYTMSRRTECTATAVWYPVCVNCTVPYDAICVVFRTSTGTK